MSICRIRYLLNFLIASSISAAMPFSSAAAAETSSIAAVCSF
ncbi:hypothetical protein [Pelotomaculum sp. PtaB.Bin117]|nr:hypothetical protein [Pelotomaculum sp. PtaB.Bin117]